MASTVFAFRSGRSHKNIDPQLLGEALEKLRLEKGRLVPEDVVEAARAEDHPAHNGLTWDEGAAAHKCRLNEARQLIVSVRILNGPTAVPVPAYISVRNAEHGRSYMPSAVVLSDDELKMRALDEVRACIESLERKYAHYRQAAEALAALRRNVG